MSQLSLVLQETVRRGREARTILEVLREQMDDGDAATAGRRSFKQRLRLTGIGCCGAVWGFGRTATITVEDDEGQHVHLQQQQPRQQQLPNLSQLLILGQAAGSDSDPGCLGPVNSGSGMNLAAALAAERHYREADEAASGGGAAPGTPMRVSLMRLLEETEMDGCDEAAEKNEKAAAATAGVVGCDSVCCVCMGRKKGAAFIPCGHTFCRVCSREVWLNRGSCPLCNRTILEILDIF
ncbi:hypothetical protein ABKV19_007000 [Rosa sericea]